MSSLFFTDEEKKISRRRQTENKILITTCIIWILTCCSIFYKEAVSSMANDKAKTELDLENYEYIFDEKMDMDSLPVQYADETRNKQLEAVSLMGNISNSVNLVCSESTQMLVIVNSNIRRIQRRSTIRTSWTPTESIERVFLLGIPAGYDTRQIPAYKEMQKEVERHGDGIVLNVVENTGNKTIKVLGGSKFARDACPVPYYLIVEDDLDVNVTALETILENKSLQNGSIWCLNPVQKPRVRREGRWMVPTDEFEQAYFPPYCANGNYILSKITSSVLYKTALETENFRFPDVHLTGILRKKSKLVEPQIIDDKYCTKTPKLPVTALALPVSQLQL